MPSFSQILAQDQADSGVLTTVAYATASDLPLIGNSSGDIAFVDGLNRLFIWNGSGWYNIALINTNPTITTGPNASYVFAKDGTPIVITLVANDPEGIPITWSHAVTTGSLGNTATITNVDNVFTITPSTLEADAGEFSITFTASDGVNLATAASTFTLVFAVDGWEYAKVSVGTNGTVIYDKTGLSTLNLVGNVDALTNVTKYDDRSLHFDGAGDVISTNVGQGTTTEDFTMEAWVYTIPHGSSPHQGIMTFTTVSTPGTTTGTCLYILNGNSLDWYSNGIIIRVTNVIAPYNWIHVAVTRTSGVARMFVNGTQVGPNTSWAGALGTQLDIGVQTGLWFNGYMEGVQYFKGHSKYTTNFTVPNAEQGQGYQATS
tara:strand:- start:662 stop:1786 length:1125 start_codon:yes stop_codon:yes gene_type:complete